MRGIQCLILVLLPGWRLKNSTWRMGGPPRSISGIPDRLRPGILMVHSRRAL